MARVTKDHDVRRDELLDAAAVLFAERGYEGTTVSAIIERVGVAKGTFYHYFPSKEHLLDALVGRVSEGVVAAAREGLAVPGLCPVEKLNAFFAAATRHKRERMALMLALMEGLYRSGNEVLRQRILEDAVRRCRPVLGAIVAEGVARGDFDTGYPDEAADAIMRLGGTLQEAIHERFGSDPAVLARHGDELERLVRFYGDAVERLLGAERGRVDLDGGQTRLMLDALRGVGPREAEV